MKYLVNRISLPKLRYYAIQKAGAKISIFATCHEYLLVYTKYTAPAGQFSVEKDDTKLNKDYKLTDENGKYRLLELRNTHREFGKENRPNLWYPIMPIHQMDQSHLNRIIPTQSKYFLLA